MACDSDETHEYDEKDPLDNAPLQALRQNSGRTPQARPREVVLDEFRTACKALDDAIEKVDKLRAELGLKRMSVVSAVTVSATPEEPPTKRTRISFKSCPSGLSGATSSSGPSPPGPSTPPILPTQTPQRRAKQTARSQGRPRLGGCDGRQGSPSFQEWMSYMGAQRVLALSVNNVASVVRCGRASFYDNMRFLYGQKHSDECEVVSVSVTLQANVLRTA